MRIAVWFVWKQRFPPHPPSRCSVVATPFTLWRDGTFPAGGEGKTATRSGRLSADWGANDTVMALAA
jgi:hypothetical protein